MAERAERNRLGLSVEAFRSFYQGRPDEERWELINDVPMMMAPPTFVHQRIASNLERLLNDALEKRDPARAAYQRGGLNLKRAVANYDPEPDVVVVDVVLAPDQHYVDRFYLAAEVVSDSDRKTLTGKREIYKLHQHCSCVLTVRQDRCHIRHRCANRNGLAGEVALQARRRACAARVRPTLQGRRVVQGDPTGAATREETQLRGTLEDYKLRRRDQPMS